MIGITRERLLFKINKTVISKPLLGPPICKVYGSLLSITLKKSEGIKEHPVSTPLLAGTIDHQIVTKRGVVPLKELVEGDIIFSEFSLIEKPIIFGNEVL